MKDIERNIFIKDNRKKKEWDDDIAVLFYDGDEILRGTLDMIRHCDLRTDDIVYDFKEYEENRRIVDVYEKLLFDEKSCSYKFGFWELIIMDI